MGWDKSMKPKKLSFRGLEEDTFIPVKKLPPRKRLSDLELIKSLTQTLPYDIKWAIELIRNAEEGGTIESFCSRTGISPSQLEKWKEIPEFSEAFRLAQVTEITFWEDLVREAILGGETEEINAELIKICRFKLESLGYKNKKYAENKVVFKEATHKKDKKQEITLAASKDLANLTEEDIEALAKTYLSKK